MTRPIGGTFAPALRLLNNFKGAMPGLAFLARRQSSRSVLFFRGSYALRFPAVRPKSYAGSSSVSTVLTLFLKIDFFFCGLCCVLISAHTVVSALISDIYQARFSTLSSRTSLIMDCLFLIVLLTLDLTEQTEPGEFTSYCFFGYETFSRAKYF